VLALYEDCMKQQFISSFALSFVLIVLVTAITECGSVLQPSPSGKPLVTGWELSCYVSRSDSAISNVQCRDLIKNLPGIGMTS
jgi:hypothetical protein